MIKHVISGVAKGWIYGILRTYWYQNSKYSDFVRKSSLLFQRHLKQRWDQAVLKELFVSALNKLKSQLEAPDIPTDVTPTPPSQSQNEEDQLAPPEEDPEMLFLHLQFHPGDIPRREVRKIYEDTCGEVFRDTVGIEKILLPTHVP